MRKISQQSLEKKVVIGHTLGLNFKKEILKLKLKKR